MKYGKVGFPDAEITAKNIIIATGSVPFVPRGIEVDGKFIYLFLLLHVLLFQKCLAWIMITYLSKDIMCLNMALGLVEYSSLVPVNEPVPHGAYLCF